MSVTTTKIFQIDPDQPDLNVIALAVDVLLGGGLVAFPTETVYGLGANGFSEEAVARIFVAKQRPLSDPIILHISSLAQLADVATDIPALAYQLAEQYWPGPLTLVLKRNPKIPANVSAGLPTVAVRMPSHKIALALLDLALVPIAAPSANLFSRPSATTSQHVLEDLGGRIDAILDGGFSPIGLESTVVDLTQSPPVLLRPGGVPLERLQQQIPALQVKQSYVPLEAEETPLASPGLLLKHYSPKAKLFLIDGQGTHLQEKMRQLTLQLVAHGYKVGLMTTQEESAFFAGLPATLVSLGASDNLAEVGRNLFARMRTLDEQNVDIILTKVITAEGIGLAIADRLLRASERRIVNLDEATAIERILAFVK